MPGSRVARGTEMGLFARWSLHVALIAALGAFVVASEDRSVLLLLIPLALAPALRWSRAPRIAVRLLPLVCHVALAATFVLAVLSRQLRLIPEVVGLRAAGIAGWTLALLAVVFLLGHRLWPAATTLLPAIIGVLAVSGLRSRVSFYLFFAVVSAVALWAFAFARGGPRRLGPALVAFILASAAASAALIEGLPRAQPMVERAVARAFAEGTTGLSAESRLGEFGSLATSDRVVLRVWSTRPQALRAYVFTRFDGREWTASDRHAAARMKRVLPNTSEGLDQTLAGVRGHLFVLDPEPPRLGPDPPGEPGGDIVETRVLQSDVKDWPLLVPPAPRYVRAPAPFLLKSPEGELRWPPYDPARLYATGRSPETSRPLDEALSSRGAALGLPARLDPRFRVLAGTLATDATSDRARLDNTVAWLRAHLTYTLDVGEFRTRDPLAEFLFDKKAGYCEYFASAAAVLLRLQGIPTRYVKGFNVGPHNRVEGGWGIGAHHLVRESDAHAWVEAYVEGEGWIEADPTPADAYAALHRWNPGLLERLNEALRVHFAEAWATLRQEGLGGLVDLVRTGTERLAGALWRHPFPAFAAFALLALAFGRHGLRAAFLRARARRRARRERRAALPGQLEPLLSAVEGHWERRGRPRSPTRGLREHLRGLPPAVLSPSERRTCARVVDACYRAAYGGVSPDEAELARLELDVAALG